MTQSSTQSPKPDPIIIHKNNSTPLVASIIFLALVIGAAALYIGDQTQKSIKATPVPSPSVTEQSQTPTTIPNNIDALPSWESYIGNKVKGLTYPGYSLSYPPEWTQKEIKDELTSTLTLTKNGNEIKIYQAPTGGNLCIFEGSLPDGPANDYRNNKYIDIIVDGITLRRIVPDQTQGLTNYSFCSNSEISKDSFLIPTFIGNITYTLPKNDESTISEMDKILSTIKVQE